MEISTLINLATISPKYKLLPEYLQLAINQPLAISTCHWIFFKHVDITAYSGPSDHDAL